MIRNTLSVWLAFVLMGFSFSGYAATAPVETDPGASDALASAEIATSSGPSSVASLDVLSSADEATYRKIFELQKRGNWAEADATFKKINDDILMGHVLAQRYLHPNYRSSYDELKRWLDKYVDHPQAERLYKLAVNRKPKGAASPKIPPGLIKKKPGKKEEGGIVISTYTSTKSLSGNQRRLLRQYVARINNYLKRGGPSAALKVLNQSDMKNLVDAVEYDTLSARIANSYLLAQDYSKAWQLANKAANGSGKQYPIGHWTAGLAAWHLKNYDDAGYHFEALAEKKDISTQVTSAAAFWAARVHWMNKRWDQSELWLKQAAKHPRTFYGLLAHRSLGTKPTFRWNARTITSRDYENIIASPAGKRAAGLLQVGDIQDAQMEMRSIHSDPALTPSVMAMAQAYDMPNISVRAARAMEKQTGDVYDGAMYPTIDWMPRGGYKIDKALIHAIIHQESNFNPEAVSHAGASGLMQLMPRTAQYISNNQNFRGANRTKLYEPAFNMMLGQKYIRYLFDKEDINGNLLKTFAAYNGGLGNVRKWTRNYGDKDPLLFIEMIPLSETKDYVKRVAANMWIYQYKFKSDTPSLDVLVDGRWPRYGEKSVSGKTENAQKRDTPRSGPSGRSVEASTSTMRSGKDWSKK